MTGVRMDKWLWAARFFKTRSLAARACDLGRIEANGQPAKPAREVRLGDQLVVRNEGGEFQIEVLQLSEMRGPAAVAQTLYGEREASKAARAKLASAYASAPLVNVLPEGAVPNLRRMQETDCVEINAFADTATDATIVVCALDNLGKGAAWQAVQNANLALGLEETAGLRIGILSA